MPLKLIPDNTNIGFVRRRYLAFALTLLLTLGSVGLLATRGLNLGVDFVGGLTMEVAFPKAPPLDALRGEVQHLNVGDVALQEFGAPTNILIRLPLPPGDQAAVQRVVAKVQADLKAKYGNVSFRRTESVSGKVSQRADPQGCASPSCCRWRRWRCSRGSASNGTSACRPSSRWSTTSPSRSASSR